MQLYIRNSATGVRPAAIAQPPRSGRVDISGRNPAAIGGHGAGAGLSATGDQPVGAQGSASVTTHDRRLERAVVLSWTARMMTPTTLMNIIRATGSTSVANDVADLRLAQNLPTATPAPAVRQGAQQTLPQAPFASGPPVTGQGNPTNASPASMKWRDLSSPPRPTGRCKPHWPHQDHRRPLKIRVPM